MALLADWALFSRFVCLRTRHSSMCSLLSRPNDFREDTPPHSHALLDVLETPDRPDEHLMKPIDMPLEELHRPRRHTEVHGSLPLPCLISRLPSVQSTVTRVALSANPDWLRLTLFVGEFRILLPPSALLFFDCLQHFMFHEF
jgi:hypothetical protein